MTWSIRTSSTKHRHTAHLDVLIPAATEIITLTPAPRPPSRPVGPAGRGHPTPPRGTPRPTAAASPRQPAGGREFVIGVHAKNLRANIDPLPVLVALDAAPCADLPDTIVQGGSAPRGHVPRRAQGASSFENGCSPRHGDPQWRISVHPMFTDDELWAYLGSLDLCVLPYRFGTHSGWLEACVDLGTGALVPDIGYYAEQHGHPRYSLGPDGTVDKTGFIGEIRLLHQDISPARPRPAGPGRATQAYRRRARTAVPPGARRQRTAGRSRMCGITPHT